MEKEKILVAGVEVEFNDLLESSQKRLYLLHKEKFEEHAAKSQFSRIRRLVVEDPKAKSCNLDAIFAIELVTKGENMSMLWYHPNFKRTDEKRRMLSKSEGSIDIRVIPAEDNESSSEFLNEQLLGELQSHALFSVIEAILNNKNLKLKDENRKMLANSNNRHIRNLVAKEETGSSEFLNEMLRKELEGEKIEWIVDTIIANKNFVMEEETREMLAKSKEYQLWKKVLRDKGCSSQFLNQMCRKAILEKDYYFSIDEIIEHENFQLEDKTLEMLHKNWYAKTRKKLARDERTSYETLEKMYAKETEEEVLTIIELHLLRRLAKQYPLSQTIK